MSFNSQGCRLIVKFIWSHSDGRIHFAAFTFTLASLVERRKTKGCFRYKISVIIWTTCSTDPKYNSFDIGEMFLDINS